MAAVGCWWVLGGCWVGGNGGMLEWLGVPPYSSQLPPVDVAETRTRGSAGKFRAKLGEAPVLINWEKILATARVRVVPPSQHTLRSTDVTTYYVQHTYEDGGETPFGHISRIHRNISNRDHRYHWHSLPSSIIIQQIPASGTQVPNLLAEVGCHDVNLLGNRGKSWVSVL